MAATTEFVVPKSIPTTFPIEPLFDLILFILIILYFIFKNRTIGTEILFKNLNKIAYVTYLDKNY